MLNRLLSWYVKKFFRPQIASTPEEKNAVFRFRYKVFIEQMNWRAVEGVDHEKKTLSFPLDLEEGAYIMYLGKIDNIIASSTLRTWKRGQIPDSIKETYRMDLFPFIDELDCAEGTYLCIDREARNKFILPVLYYSMFLYLQEKKLNMDIMFSMARPALVPYYRKQAFRTYSNHFIPDVEGLNIPLLMLPHDISYLKQKKVIYRFAFEKYIESLPFERQNEVTKINAVIKNQILKGENVITSPSEIRNLLEKHELNSENCLLLSSLTTHDLLKLLTLVLKIPPNQFILTKSTEDRDIYVVLDGKAEVEINTTPIEILSKGSLFGEMAFFLNNGRRTADIKTLTDCTVAVIRRNDLKRIMNKHPKIASQFLLAMTKVVCMRLAAVTDAYAR